MRLKADVTHGNPTSQIMEPIILGIIFLKLYGSMKRHAALDAPSIHKNILIVDIKGRLDIRDLKENTIFFNTFVVLYIWNKI